MLKLKWVQLASILPPSFGSSESSLLVGELGVGKGLIRKEGDGPRRNGITNHTVEHCAVLQKWLDRVPFCGALGHSASSLVCCSRSAWTLSAIPP